MKAVYKMRFGGIYRGGKVEGLFVAEPDEVAAAIGKEVYFGEILGKHSEIYGTLDADEVTEVSTDPAVVAFVEEHGPFGYNPLHYLREDRE